MLNDGFKTLITFSNNPSAEVYEKQVTPPGVDGGAPIDTTTMRNTSWRTFFSRSLKTLSALSLNGAYTTKGVYTHLLVMVNQNQLITVTFADGSTVAFWGFIQTVTPGAATEGEQPTVDITIAPTNRNNSNQEVAPEYLSAESQSS